MSGRRAAWNVIDQAFSSATNFGIAIVAARTLSPEAFGAFSIALLLYVVALGTSRGLSTEALMIRFSAATVDEHRAAARAATGTALLVGTAGGVLLLLAAIPLTGPVRGTVLTLGCFLPLLLLQDAWRFVFFSSGRPAAASANDAVWGITQVATVAGALQVGWSSPAALLGAWAGAAALAACVGGIQARTLPLPTQAVRWWRAHRELALPSAAEFLGTTGLMQLTIFGLTGVIGLAGVAALRGAQTLLGPINMALLAVETFAAAEGARTLRHKPGRLRRHLVTQSSALGVVTVGAGLLLWRLPDAYGRALLGETWELARHAMLPYALLLVARAAASGPYAGLKIVEAVSVNLRIRVGIGVLTIATGTIGGHLGGLTYAALGMAIPSLLAVPVWWQHLLIKLRPLEGSAGSRQPPPAAGPPRREALHTLSEPTEGVAPAHEEVRGTC